MLPYTLKRLASAVVVLLVVSLLTFILTRVLFPNPARAILGGQSSFATPEQIQRLTRQLGLDDPIPIQYVQWLGDTLQGDLGRSYVTPMSVSDAIAARIPVTVELTALALAIALLVGLCLGIIAAVRRGGWLDTVTSTASVVALSLPNFFLGIILIYIFAFQLRLLPSVGYTPFTVDPIENLKYMVLPALTLSAAYVGVFARYTRALMISVLSEDYILRAHAGGVLPASIVGRHALRNTLIPLITVVGISAGGLVGGAVVTETVFSVPGIGTLLTDAILGKHLPVLQGLVLVITVGVVFINLGVDLLYGIIDPRIRVS